MLKFGPLFEKLFPLFVVSLSIALAPARCHSDLIVAEGWDLFNTPGGAMFAGVEWKGIPVGSFDFGPGIGVRSTGNTDTIVQRLQEAQIAGPAPGTAIPIDIELVALQLRTVSQVNLGAGLGFYFATLETERNVGEVNTHGVGDTSTGTMTISFDDMEGGTFDSALNVRFDVRFGSLNGAIVAADQFTFLPSSGSDWSRTPAPGALQILDVNRFLKGNGTDDQDFWGVPDHTGPHPVKRATIPEPGTEGVVAILLMAVSCQQRKRRTLF